MVSTNDSGATRTRRAAVFAEFSIYSNLYEFEVRLNFYKFYTPKVFYHKSKFKTRQKSSCFHFSKIVYSE